MLNWLRRYIAWLCVGAALVGIGAAIWGWQSADRVEDVMAEGKDAVALIEGASSVTRKSVLTYTVNLAWKDDTGKVLRARDVPITTAFANKIISDGVLVVPSVEIRYLQAGPKYAAVVKADSGSQLSRAINVMWLGLGGLALGCFGGWVFGFRAWRMFERGDD